MDEVTVALFKDKETKNTVRYAEPTAPPDQEKVIGVLYVPRTTLALLNGGGIPESITLTVRR